MNIDRVLGAGAILLAIPVGVASWGFGVGSVKSPGAGFWPLVIAAAMGLLGLSLLLAPGPVQPAPRISDSRWVKFGIALGTLGLYAFALVPLGYLLTTAIMLDIQFRWVEGRSWRSSTTIAVLAAVVSYAVFRVLLKVSLPVGVIPLPNGW